MTSVNQKNRLVGKLDRLDIEVSVFRGSFVVLDWISYIEGGYLEHLWQRRVPLFRPLTSHLSQQEWWGPILSPLVSPMMVLYITHNYSQQQASIVPSALSLLAQQCEHSHDIQFSCLHTQNFCHRSIIFKTIKIDLECVNSHKLNSIFLFHHSNHRAENLRMRARF